ncbi:unnamed protein product, partial [Adineta steineri]
FFNGGDGECSSDDDCEQEVLFLTVDNDSVVLGDGKTCFCARGLWVGGDVEEEAVGVIVLSFKHFCGCCGRIPNLVTS